MPILSQEHLALIAAFAPGLPDVSDDTCKCCLWMPPWPQADAQSQPRCGSASDAGLLLEQVIQERFDGLQDLLCGFLCPQTGPPCVGQLHQLCVDAGRL